MSAGGSAGGGRYDVTRHGAWRVARGRTSCPEASPCLRHTNRCCATLHGLLCGTPCTNGPHALDSTSKGMRSSSRASKQPFPCVVSHAPAYRVGRARARAKASGNPSFCARWSCSWRQVLGLFFLLYIKGRVVGCFWCVLIYFFIRRESNKHIILFFWITNSCFGS